MDESRDRIAYAGYLIAGSRVDDRVREMADSTSWELDVRHEVKPGLFLQTFRRPAWVARDDAPSTVAHWMVVWVSASGWRAHAAEHMQLGWILSRDDVLDDGSHSVCWHSPRLRLDLTEPEPIPRAGPAPSGSTAPPLCTAERSRQPATSPPSRPARVRSGRGAEALAASSYRA